MIREHGRSVEADLAFQQIDVRDVFRVGSGMTFRRLRVLIEGLPWDSNTMTAIRESQVSSLTAAERIRERQAHYGGAPQN